MSCSRAPQATLVLALLACAMPAAADPSDEELEATMEVLDDLADVGDVKMESRGADEDAAAIRYDVFGERIGDAAGEDGADEEPLPREAGSESGPRDDFEHDDIDETDRQRELETEDDFEDGEEVDYDEPDEP